MNQDFERGHRAAGAAVWAMGDVSRNSTEYRVSEGEITLPQGFSACGIHCGIKKGGTRDLAAIYSEEPASAAAVFTENRVKAAPVIVSREHLLRTSGEARAIIANSGNANAVTGKQGLRDASHMAELLGKELHVPAAQVLVASTGVIGVNLPMDKIEAGIRRIRENLSRDGAIDAAHAILTTDKVAKVCTVRTDIGGRDVILSGMAKGSGMIHPNMATMLAFIATDAAIAPHMVKFALTTAVNRSFNMTTVDGDMSTNDTVFVLANGLAGNPPIMSHNRDSERFGEALTRMCTSLARMIAKDGEGATKFLEVCVRMAANIRDARYAARSIAASNLVKTAVFGADPNWGRIFAALGACGVEFNPDFVSIWIGNIKVVESGQAADYDEDAVREVLTRPEITITVQMNTGFESATAYSCDLTYDYIKINSSYRS